MPEWVRGAGRDGRLGEKTRRGLLQEGQGKDDPDARLEDRRVRAAADGRRSRRSRALAKKPLAAAAARRAATLPGKYGEFLRALPAAPVALRADDGAGARVRHRGASTARWSGATRWEPARSSRWTRSASTSCATASRRRGSTCRALLRAARTARFYHRRRTGGRYLAFDGRIAPVRAGRRGDRARGTLRARAGARARGVARRARCSTSATASRCSSSAAR